MHVLKIWKPALPVAALAGLALVAGCASNGTKPTTTPLAVSGGMYCPKCEMVWVTRPVGQGTKVARLQSERKMKCPTCDTTAASYLTSEGKVMLHECPECKVTPVLVQPTTEPTGSAGAGS